MNDDELIPLVGKKNIRADAARNRERLLSTAQRLFAEQGVQCVTMSAIAKEAQVGKGTLYRHFSDKAELCRALLDTDMRALQQETLARLQSDVAALPMLRWFLGHTAAWVLQHADFLCEVAAQSEGEMLHHPAHLWWRQTILALLQRLALPGDVEYTADALYLLLDVRTLLYQQEVQGYDLQRITDGLHEVLGRLVGAGE